MGLNLDLTEVKLLARTIFVKGKRTLDNLTDSYNNFFQSSIEDTKSVYLDSANKYRDKGDYESAIKAYLKILEFDSRDTFVLNELGRIYLKVGLVREAIDVFEQAVTVGDHSSQTYFNLGSAYYMNDNNTQAIKSFEEAIRIDSNFYEAYYKLGLVYDSIGEHDKAIDLYKKVISLNPDHIKAYQSLGLSYESKGMRDEAVKYFKKALEKEEKKL